jgi:hypothetical protein
MLQSELSVLQNRVAVLAAWEQEQKQMNNEPVFNNSLQEYRGKQALKELQGALRTLHESKSQDRTEKDRYIAIAVTDLEKLIAFVEKYF